MQRVDSGGAHNSSSDAAASDERGCIQKLSSHACVYPLAGAYGPQACVLSAVVHAYWVMWVGSA